MKNWWLLPFGILFGLWLSERDRRLTAERQQPIQIPMPQTPVQAPALRKDRTLEELSPSLAKERSAGRSIYSYPPGEVAQRIRRVFKQLIQPDMTPLEAERVCNEITADAIHLMSHRESWADKVEEALEGRYGEKFVAKFNELRHSPEFEKMEQELIRDYFYQKSLEEDGENPHEQGTN